MSVRVWLSRFTNFFEQLHDILVFGETDVPVTQQQDDVH